MVRVRDLDRNRIRKFLTDKRGVGLQPRTCRNIFTIIRSILACSIETYCLAHPAAKLGRVLKLNIGKARRAEEINALTKEQRQKFLTVCQISLRFSPLFATLAGTGMRLREVLALHPGDLDLKGSCLRINRAFDEVGRLSTPKKRMRKNRRPVTSFGEHVDSTFTDASRGTTPIWLGRLSVLCITNTGQSHDPANVPAAMQWLLKMRDCLIFHTALLETYVGVNSLS